MKTNLVRMAVLVLAAATMAVPAFAGENPSKTDFEMQWGMQKANPAENAKDYKHRVALETGNLPSDAGGNPTVDFPTESDGGG